MINPNHPRLTVPEDVANEIDIHHITESEAAIETLFPESFFKWLEEVVYTEDWGLTSWEIASETLLWNPISSLQEAWNDGELLENLETTSLNDVSADQVFEYLKGMQEWNAEGEAPGLHIFPLQIGDNLIYLVGALEFWQGGFVPVWIGITRDINNIEAVWQSTGRRGLSDTLTRDDTEAIWTRFVSDLESL